ncbi:MAG: hypoxanthine phosphoribosyltransferase [Myxococcota bacterium]|nr:hypoxanthine phosphoribosyltransferase [Myxococcota bacterium]
MTTWRDHIDVLYDAETIKRRIAELGAQITRDLAGRSPIFVGILKGSVPFFADLIRAVDLPVQCEFMGISSYGDDTESSGVVQITYDLTKTIEGKDVVLVEDIVDTGLSMQYLLASMQTRKPASVRVCTLLEKPDNARVKIPLDYVGFRIPNEFVIGYGLDYAGKYRNLPFIGVYRGPT